MTGRKSGGIADFIDAIRRRVREALDAVEELLAPVPEPVPVPVEDTKRRR